MSKPIVAIVGRPNVGKSMLFNKLIGQRLSIVEDTPGVTRDRIYGECEWCGRKFTLVDTGGIEPRTDSQILTFMREQAQIAIENATVIIFLTDIKTGLTASDQEVANMLLRSRKPIVLAVNKMDSVGAPNPDYYEFYNLGLGDPVAVSAVHGHGTGDLLDACVAYFPDEEEAEEESDVLKVAIIGNPNVGKSSLLNQLAHEERTVVNDLAGTTRDPVDEVVTVDGEDWLFIDTAGIKRRLHKLSGAEYFSSLRTQAAIERSELALVLFDASQPISDQDLKVMSQAVDAGRCIVLVFNKWDLMDEFDRQRMERLWKTEFNRVTWAQRVNLSAKTGWHTNRLANAMRGALASWDKRIPTGKLNAFLGKIQAAHPHPLRGGKQPRILFATQASTRPPRFVIFATGFLEHGYRRYIERCLREEFGFEGSPIQISVNVREKKKRK